MEDALGLEDFRPWLSPQRARRTVDVPVVATRPPSSNSEEVEEAPLRRLLRECCTAMGKREVDAQRFWTRLQAEWLDTPQQLRLLTLEGWQRLALPVGLETELQRRLGKDKEKLRKEDSEMHRPKRSVTPPPKTPKTTPKPVGPKTTAAQTSATGTLRQLLRSRCGDHWASQLIAQLGLQRSQGVDANALQSALRSLGLPSFSQAAVSGAVRSATGSREARGLPSAEEVVATIHGPLNGARSRAVDEVFFDLGGDIHGTLPRQMLKRRMATLELPSVKAGFSAEEALRNFTRPWGFRQEVDRENFSAAHILLSALHRGEDEAFNHLLRRIWRLPKPERSEDAGKASPVPRLVSRTDVNKAFKAGEERQVPSSDRDRSEQRRNVLEQEAIVHLGVGQEDRSHRIANMEDAIQRSSRTLELVERIRSALKSRGPDAVKLLTFKFQQDRSKGLGAKELRQALAQVGVGVSEEDVAELLRGMDVDGNGTVDLDEWLRVLRGPLNPYRAAAVREVFQSLRGTENFIELKTLRARLNASHHPDVEAGLKEVKEVYNEVMTQIQSRNGRISLTDFAKYYEHLSAGIQDDKYFSHILRRSWGLPTTPGNIMARNAHRMYGGHIRSTEAGLCGL